MNRIVHLDSGEIFPLDHYGIGTEPLRDAVRDVIALYLTNTSPVDVEKAFIDGSSFVIETHYDQGDLTHDAGEVDICEDYASYIVAGSVVDKGNGLVIVTMGKAMSEKEQLIAARTMERRINNLEKRLREITNSYEQIRAQKKQLEFENLRISEEFKALQDMINAVNNAQIIPEGEPIGDPDDLYPSDMPVDSLEQDEDPIYPVEEPDPIDAPPAEVVPVEDAPVVEEKPKKPKKTVEKKVYKRKTAPKTEEKPKTEKKTTRSKKKNAF